MRVFFTTSLLFTLLVICTLTSNVSAAGKAFGYLDEKTNRTLVPIRFISEQIGAEVNWNAKDKKIVINSNTTEIILTIGSKNTMIDQKHQSIEATPKIKNGTTYVPLRFVGEALQADVNWMAKTSTVKISLDDQTIQLPIVKESATSSNASAFSKSNKTFKVGSKSIKTNILTVNLLDPRVDFSIALANDQVGSVENLQSMAKRFGAKAAINGTFFNAYTDSSYKQPYGYIITNGQKVNHGDKRAVFAFDEQNNVSIWAGEEFGEQMNKQSFKGAIQAGPTLVRDGQIYLDPAGEGHSDPKILSNGGARSAIGITRDQKLILLTTRSATIPDLAKVMLQAGAYQAMNLDGGASSCLYYNGSYITPPGRDISNSLLIFYK